MQALAHDRKQRTTLKQTGKFAWTRATKLMYKNQTQHIKPIGQIHNPLYYLYLRHVRHDIHHTPPLTYKIENDAVQELNQLEKTSKSTQHTHARTVCHDRGTHAQTHTQRKTNKNTHAHTIQTHMRQTSLTEESQTTIKPLEGGHGGELNGGDHPKRLNSLK